MVTKRFIFILSVINITLYSCQTNYYSFHEYHNTNREIKKLIFADSTSSEVVIPIYLKGTAFDKSLFSVLSIEYSKIGNKKKAIESFEQYVLFGGEIDGIDFTYFRPEIAQIIKKKFHLWREKHLKNIKLYQNEINQLKELSRNDQKIRAKFSDHSNTMELLNEQSKLDSINRIVLYQIGEKLISNYYQASSLSAPQINPIIQIPSYLSHYSESDNYYFLSKMKEYAQAAKCDWSMSLKTLIFLSFKFPFYEDEYYKYNVLPEFHLKNTGEIELYESCLQLIAMSNLLTDNPFLKVELFRFNNSSAENLNRIKLFLVDTGIQEERISIDTSIYANNVKPKKISPIGWKIAKKS